MINIEEEINSIDNINNLINLKKEMMYKILQFKKKIIELEQKILIIDENIIKKCNHQWINDYTSCGEHTEYKCTICNLYK